MVDRISKQRRSENMRRIRSKGTLAELAVRRLVHAMGFRFRLHLPTLPGKPDLVLPRLRRIIEVRGCFWHQHTGCVDSHTPKSHVGYWYTKLRRNVQRDKHNLRALRKLGWRVLTLWECEVKELPARSLRSRLRRFLGASRR